MKYEYKYQMEQVILLKAFSLGNQKLGVESLGQGIFFFFF